MGSAAAWPASSAARVGHAGALEQCLVSGYAVNAISTQLTNGKNSMGECGTSFASFFSGTCRSRGSLGAIPRQRLRRECHFHPDGQRQELHARSAVYTFSSQAVPCRLQCPFVVFLDKSVDLSFCFVFRFRRPDDLS